MNFRHSYFYTMTQPNKYTIASYPKNVVLGSKHAFDKGIVGYLRAIVVTVFTPKQISQCSSCSWVFSLMHVTVVVSILRLMFDPFASSVSTFVSTSITGSPSYIVSVVCAYIIAHSIVFGSFLSAMFWHTVLKLRVPRDTFVQTMFTVFCVLSILFDVLSFAWLPYVQSGELAWYVPEIFKTLIVTAYSYVAGNSLEVE